MDDLQFDKADYAATADAATVCAACQTPLAGEYFQINERPFCASCRSGIEQALGGKPGVGGFVKAVAGGVAGGIAGALLYYLVSLSGYELSIIAIAVGFLVGRGVRWGTGGRGGPLYQAVAIGLTYVAIVSSYVPAVIQGFKEASTTPPAASAPVEQTAGPGATPAATTTTATTTTATPDGKPPITFVGALVGLVLFFVLILALPFLGGFSNIIGLVIIGIGLWEAWRINKRVTLAITGPFAVPAPALTAPPAIPATPGS